MSARINHHRAVVHHRVAVVANAVFGGHLIIGHATGRQHGSDPDLLLSSRSQYQKRLGPLLPRVRRVERETLIGDGILVGWMPVV
jgi:hypothetical protein